MQKMISLFYVIICCSLVGCGGNTKEREAALIKDLAAESNKTITNNTPLNKTETDKQNSSVKSSMPKTYISKAGNYFPLTVGSNWTITSIHKSSIYKIDVEKKDSNDGSTSFALKQTSYMNGTLVGVFDVGYIVDKFAVTEYYIMSGKIIGSGTVLKLPIVIGDTWGKDWPSTSKLNNIIEEVNYTVEVPAGKFTNCIRNKITDSSTEKELIDYRYYAPNVGEVKHSVMKNNTEVTIFELTEYEIK